MTKIRAEFEVPDGKYCDDRIEWICPMCSEYEWGDYKCALFRDKLEIDDNNLCCIRCDKCKKAEVEE